MKIFKSRCKSRYYDSSKYPKIVQCHRPEGHSGSHHWFSFLWFMPNKTEYVWDDSTAIKED